MNLATSEMSSYYQVFKQLRAVAANIELTPELQFGDFTVNLKTLPTPVLGNPVGKTRLIDTLQTLGGRNFTLSEVGLYVNISFTPEFVSEVLFVELLKNPIACPPLSDEDRPGLNPSDLKAWQRAKEFSATVETGNQPAPEQLTTSEQQLVRAIHRSTCSNNASERIRATANLYRSEVIAEANHRAKLLSLA